MLPDGKKLNRLTSASLDIENCLRFLLELKNQEYGSTIYEGLLIAAVIFYSRPFSANELKKSPYPSDIRISDDLLKTLDNNETDLDEKIKNLRNKAIAHAEYSFHPTGFTNNKIIKAKPFSLWEHFKNERDIDLFISAAKKILTEIQIAKLLEINKIT